MKRTRALLAIPLLAVLATATGCETTPVQDGAVLGGALGAAAGAVIGHQSGHQGEGALIGAGAGAIIGAIAGDQVDENRSRAYSAPTTQRPVQTAQRGRYQTRVTRAPNGELYEERVWVPE